MNSTDMNAEQWDLDKECIILYKVLVRQRAWGTEVGDWGREVDQR